MKYKFNSKALLHLGISFGLVLFLPFVNVILNEVVKIYSLDKIIFYLFCVVAIYFTISLVIVLITMKKDKKTKEELKLEKAIFDDYDTSPRKNKIVKKRIVYKSERDRLYEEAVKYYGKSAVKYRSKDTVIEDYLKEEGSFPDKFS